MNHDATKTCYVFNSQKLTPVFKRHSACYMGECIAGTSFSPHLSGIPAEEGLSIKWKTCCKGPI